MDNDELYHHGIKGMKWGVRRYQNKDGSYTQAGKRRASSSNSKSGNSVGAKIKTSMANRKASQHQKTLQKKAKEEALKESRKSVKDMTDEELIAKTRRLEAERNYLQAKKQVAALQPKQVSKGQAFVKHVGNNVIKPAVTEAGKKYLTEMLNKQVKKSVGVDVDEMAKLKKEVDKLKLKKSKVELEDYFVKREKGVSTDDDDGTLTKKERSDIEKYVELLMEERDTN